MGQDVLIFESRLCFEFKVVIQLLKVMGPTDFKSRVREKVFHYRINFKGVVGVRNKDVF